MFETLAGAVAFTVDVAILGTLVFQGWILWKLLPEITYIARKTDGVAAQMDRLSPFDLVNDAEGQPLGVGRQ